MDSERGRDMQKRTLFGYLTKKGFITVEDAANATNVPFETAEEWQWTDGLSSFTNDESKTLAELVFEKGDKNELDIILERISPGSKNLPQASKTEVLCKALRIEWNDSTANSANASTSIFENLNVHKKEKTNVPIRIYLPQCNERVPAAIKAFWKVVEETTVPCDIYVADWGMYAFDDVEQSVFQYCADEMISAVKRGFNVHILTPEKNEYADGRTVLRQLPLYLNERITYYRLFSDTKLPANESWMSLGMKTVLLVRLLPSEAPVTTLIQEPTLAQFYYNWTQILIAETRPINHHMDDRDTVQIFTRMKSDVHPLLTVYFLESAPSCLHMSPQLQREVLKANDASDEEIAQCQKISMLRASIRSICRCTQIYNGDRILQLLQQDKYKDPMISGILGRPAYVTSEQLKKQLRFFLSETEHTNYTMYLPSFEMDLRLSQCGVSIAVQEDSMTAVMDLTNRSRNFYSNDLSCTGGFSTYMEQLSKMIPPVKRSGNWTRRLLKRYIEL